MQTLHEVEHSINAIDGIATPGEHLHLVDPAQGESGSGFELILDAAAEGNVHSLEVAQREQAAVRQWQFATHEFSPGAEPRLHISTAEASTARDSHPSAAHSHDPAIAASLLIEKQTASGATLEQVEVRIDQGLKPHGRSRRRSIDLSRLPKPHEVLKPNGQPRLIYLLLSLTSLMVIYPFLEGTAFERGLLNLLMSLVLMSGVYAVSTTRRHLDVALGLSLPALAASWLNLLDAATNSGRRHGRVMAGVLLLHDCFALGLHLAGQQGRFRSDLWRGVDLHVDRRAWCALWLVNDISSKSFNNAAAQSLNDVLSWSDFLFFSFTTLTTLGYGDITPGDALARSLAVMEAVVGVFYVAILVSRLVGLYGRKPR